MSTLRAVLVGETGFERAAVWSAVGFGVVTVAFEAAAEFGVPPTAWIAVAVAAVGLVGVVSYAAVGAGALPCVLLVYGPFAAVLVRLLEPLFLAETPVEPLLVAVVAAFSAGLGGYVVGATVASLLSPDGPADGSVTAETDTEDADDAA